MHARMKGLMDAEGLPYSRRTHTYNSRLAQELAKWADSQTGFEAIHDALYRAYFVDGRNIGDSEVLVEIAQSVGLPGQAAREVLADRSFKNAVDADWEKARQYGVTGVPTFVAGGYKLVGAHPYDVLEKLMRAAGAPERYKQGAPLDQRMPDLLPIYSLETEIISTLTSTRRLVLQAPTGSGKSTQVPQMLLKHGLLANGQVVILQPRRIAARLLASRVAHELGTTLGRE